MKNDIRTAVYLLAQNRLLREALSKILGRKNDIILVGCSSLSETSVQQIVSTTPDVLVIDSFVTDSRHIDFVREVQQELSVKLVVIGMDLEPHLFLEAIRNGIMGYLAKDAATFEVADAVRTVARGGAVCSSALCAFLFRFAERQHQMPSFHARQCLGLTTREQQLVGLIAQGLTNKEIALHLSLAENTVRNHIHRMLRKVGVGHRLAVVDACRVQGIAV